MGKRHDKSRGHNLSQLMSCKFLPDYDTFMYDTYTNTYPPLIPTTISLFCNPKITILFDAYRNFDC